MFSLSGPLAFELYALWCLACALLAIRVKRDYGWISGATFAWIFMSAVRVFAQPGGPYEAEEPAWLAGLSLASTSTVLSIVVALFAIQKLNRETWITIFKAAAIVNAVLMFFYKPGIFLNYSIGGCFNVSALPLFISKRGRIFWFPLLLLPISALYTLRAQPIGMLCVLIMLYVLKGQSLKQWLIAISGAFACVATLLLTHVTSDHTRFDVWADVWRFSQEHVSYVFGAGIGTFFYIGPFLTKTSKEGLFLWMHSDWLQIAFETGIVGFALSVALYVQALYKAKRDYNLFAMLIMYGIFAVANFPLHLPVSALFGLFLLSSALATAPKEKSTLRQHCQASPQTHAPRYCRSSEACTPESCSL